MNSKVEQILSILDEVASSFGESFLKRLGPGKDAGNGVTNQFMSKVNAEVASRVGHDLADRRICGETNFSVDFYVPEQATVIEVELSARNPHTNLERDLFKTFLANQAGNIVRKLVLVGKPGTLKRLALPDLRAIAAWSKEKQDVQLEVIEIPRTSIA